jgi:hypothetical protein
MLLAARDRGALIFEAFSNSPPYWMTVSGAYPSSELALMHIRQDLCKYFLPICLSVRMSLHHADVMQQILSSTSFQSVTNVIEWHASSFQGNPCLLGS